MQTVAHNDSVVAKADDGVVTKETTCYYGDRQQRGIPVVRQGCYKRSYTPPMPRSKDSCLLGNNCCLSSPYHTGKARHNAHPTGPVVAT